MALVRTVYRIGGKKMPTEQEQFEPDIERSVRNNTTLRCTNKNMIAEAEVRRK